MPNLPMDDLEPVEFTTESAPPRRRIPVSWVIAFLILGILTAAVALNGGFERRRLVTELGGPQLVDIGPATVHLTHATYEVLEPDDTAKYFDVTLFGTCQVTVDESFNSGYAIAEAVFLPNLDPTIIPQDAITQFTWEGTAKRYSLPPGMPPYDCTFTFNVPVEVETKSGDTLRVAFSKLIWGDRYAVQFGEMSWYPDNTRFEVIEIPWQEEEKLF